MSTTSPPVSRAPMRVAALLGAAAVAAGAFGAHGLETRVTPERLETWHTASNYHLVHAVALLALSLAPVPRRLTSILFLCGILVFSGSLYALVLLDLPILGAIAPLGGVCFIAGWLNLARSR